MTAFAVACFQALKHRRFKPHPLPSRAAHRNPYRLNVPARSSFLFVTPKLLVCHPDFVRSSRSVYLVIPKAKQRNLRLSLLSSLLSSLLLSLLLPVLLFVIPSKARNPLLYPCSSSSTKAFAVAVVSKVQRGFSPASKPSAKADLRSAEGRSEAQRA